MESWFRLGEAHRSKCAMYDAKPPILVCAQLSHNETVQSYGIRLVSLTATRSTLHWACRCVCSSNKYKEFNEWEKKKKKMLRL